jgi:hypothetical protein
MTVAEQVQAERRLGDTLDQYPGEWVAVLNHEVIAHADTLEALLEQIEASEEVEVFQIAEDPHVACFF